MTMIGNAPQYVTDLSTGTSAGRASLWSSSNKTLVVLGCEAWRLVVPCLWTQDMEYSSANILLTQTIEISAKILLSLPFILILIYMCVFIFSMVSFLKTFVLFYLHLIPPFLLLLDRMLSSRNASLK